MVGHEGRWATLAGLVPICPWGTLADLTPKYLTLVARTPPEGLCTHCGLCAPAVHVCGACGLTCLHLFTIYIFLFPYFTSQFVSFHGSPVETRHATTWKHPPRYSTVVLPALLIRRGAWGARSSTRSPRGLPRARRTARAWVCQATWAPPQRTSVQRGGVLVGVRVRVGGGALVEAGVVRLEVKVRVRVRVRVRVGVRLRLRLRVGAELRLKLRPRPRRGSRAPASRLSSFAHGQRMPLFSGWRSPGRRPSERILGWSTGGEMATLGPHQSTAVALFGIQAARALVSGPEGWP